MLHTSCLVMTVIAWLVWSDRALVSVAYPLTLADGERLTGTLPFQYDPRGEAWWGFERVDWHLGPQECQ